jgi:hypothetical protein
MCDLSHWLRTQYDGKELKNSEGIMNWEGGRTSLAAVVGGGSKRDGVVAGVRSSKSGRGSSAAAPRAVDNLRAPCRHS